jgi:beta-mannosidase
MSPRGRVEGHERQPICEAWQTAQAPPDEHTSPGDLDALRWIPARVPGTAARALAAGGEWRPGEPCDFDGVDWWFRTRFDAAPAADEEELLLHLDGIATVAEVYLNGELLLESESMFASHSLDLAGRLLESNELAIRCRALGPLLAERRRPRARWRTRLVAEGNLRFFRTMLLGRAPGFAPGPAVVGPWRGVCLERRRRLAVEQLELRPRVLGGSGVLAVSVRLRPLDEGPPESVEVQLEGPSGSHRVQLELLPGPDGVTAVGELVVPDVARWWPHTHGEAHLHDVRLFVSGAGKPLVIDAGRVGFRELSFGAGADHDVELDGLDLHVNGVPVFVRGAVWTPLDAIGMAPSDGQLRDTLARVVGAGMNMLRLPGTSAYETSRFHDLCDELGILVWQDFMFANLDYPTSEASFLAAVQGECARELALLAGRPSLAVLCGNSEIEQQVAMLGLDIGLARGEWFGQELPALVRQSGADALYVPSAPCGGGLPFRPDRGIANYYGVGGYRRPLEDARRAGVRFAAECLAFSNVPDDEAIEQLLPEGQPRPAVHHPAWKAGVPRDNSAGWDFEDVRDHYLESLFGVEVSELRRVDQERYLELSRTVTGEVMAEVLGEWRRSGSSCNGALVLWLRDLLPGAGWGLLDSRGEPKVAYHHLSRVLAPIAVWTVDEGLGGVVAHVANDRPRPLTAQLRVALYKDLEIRVGEARAAVELDPHGQGEWNLETMLGHFVDAAWAYRFGPPAQDAIVVSLEAVEGAGEGARVLSQAVRFPAGRPLLRESSARIGLAGRARMLPDGEVELALSSDRLAYGVRIHAPGHRPSEDCVSIEPGVERLLTLSPHDPDASLQSATLGALNMHGRVRVVLENERG